MTLTLLPGAAETIFERLVAFFEDDDWSFERNLDDGVLRMGFKGDHGTWRCVARADEERHLFLYYSVIESFTPEDRRPVMAEFVTRANYGLLIGNFELDFADGEVRFKTCVAIEDGVLTNEIIKRNVYTNLLMMDQYFPGIMAVMYTNVAPAEAIAQVEA